MPVDSVKLTIFPFDSYHCQHWFAPEGEERAHQALSHRSRAWVGLSVIRRTCRYCGHTASHTLFVVMADGGCRCKSGAACARRIQARQLGLSRHMAPPATRCAAGGATARSRACTPDRHMTGDYFAQVPLDGYFQGWCDGYAQALNDVEQGLTTKPTRNQTDRRTTDLGAAAGPEVSEKGTTN